MKKGKGRNSLEGTSKEDKATNKHGVEGVDVGEVGKSGRVGHLGPEGCRCTRENSRDEIEDSRGRYNFLARVQRRGNGDSGEN